MTWIQFEPDEPPAPSYELKTLSGATLQIADFCNVARYINVYC
jgi:hypothetical protein